MKKAKIIHSFAKIVCSLSVFMAGIAVNTTCHGRYYQEKMDEQLDSLKKYYDK